MFAVISYCVVCIAYVCIEINLPVSGGLLRSLVPLKRWCAQPLPSLGEGVAVEIECSS